MSCNNARGAKAVAGAAGLSTPPAATTFAGKRTSSSAMEATAAHRRVRGRTSASAIANSANPEAVTASSGQGTKLGTIATNPERCGSMKWVTAVEMYTALIPRAAAAGQESQGVARANPRGTGGRAGRRGPQGVERGGGEGGRATR